MEIFVDMILNQKIWQLNKRLINTMQQAALCIAEFCGSVIFRR